MPKRKPREDNEFLDRPKSRKRQRRSFWGGLLYFLWLPPIRYTILLALVGLLVWWRWSALTGLFGWGLLFIAAAIITFIVQMKRRKLPSFILRFNRWLGAVAFVLATWGILAIFDMGGEFGGALIMEPAPVVDILIVIGLFIVGVTLVAPKVCLKLVVRFLAWLGGQFHRQPAKVPGYLEKQLANERTAAPAHIELHPKSPVEEKPPMPRVMEEPVVRPERAIPKSPLMAPPEREAMTRAPALAPTTQELRQVAQEVWKKYGQSSDLVMVDGWKLPPIDILDTTPEIEFSEADNVQRAKIIEDALVSYGVEAKVVQINAGPTVTQFGVEPGWDRKLKEKKERDRNGDVRVTLEEVSKTRVKVDRITSLANDLALALAAPSIRIEAPVPGKSIVGIEVPNTSIGVVSLRSVIESSTYQKLQERSKLSLALGKGAGGEAISGDLSRMPHLLIAGATGSGKTVCLNAIIGCLLLNNTPFDTRFIMIDPKRVELTPYNSIPHLATPVIVDTKKALGTLRWLSQEMDQRYQKLASAGARNIEGYNRNREGSDKMSYMVLVIDELADLMMTSFDEVEHILCRLAQLARATGIHLVVATQRPSVDVVTGLIKANFPTRISFAVTSQVDSRTILDGAGAEKLLGRGDMLYMPTEAGKPKRLQGCFVSDSEVERLVYFWNSQKEQEAASIRIEEVAPPPTLGGRSGQQEDPLMDSARELMEQHDNISTSFLQRKLHIGYPRAARIMEQLEEEMGGDIGGGEEEIGEG